MFLSTAYLAPVQYYSKLFAAEQRGELVNIEACEHFPKQTYRNRCMIAAANGVMPLSIPVEKPDSPKALTRDIRISEHGNWRHLHWNALLSAYNASPFFEFYQDDLRPLYEEGRYPFLMDFNGALQDVVCGWIDMAPKCQRTSEFSTEVADDYRFSIRPRQPEEDLTFVSEPYYQVFQQRHGFLPNLSIVDLVFNMGPESLLVLKRSLR